MCAKCFKTTRTRYVFYHAMSINPTYMYIQPPFLNCCTEFLFTLFSKHTRNNKNGNVLSYKKCTYAVH